MELCMKKCPECKSQDIEPSRTYPTKNHGPRLIYRCKDCSNQFSETKNTFLEGLKKPISLIWRAIRDRTEGQAFNATARVCDISRTTLRAWERRFCDLHEVLLLYSLVNQFLSLEIEGDEAYTKVKKNVPAHESEGWTLLLMDRASRFIWSLECGEKDRDLFLKAMETLKQVISQSDDLSLFTDGERRYGNILFEICHELVKDGKPGRPKKTLKKGVRVRVKNKGSQAHKKGPKRPKYQSPCPEHPETDQTIENADIHANHAEAFWSSLRRKCSAFRRKTNTYAKVTGGLKRILRVYWVVHNFMRVHFTTKEVPAVTLGVIDRRLSIEELLHIQIS
jgi:transposase-like protein